MSKAWKMWVRFYRSIPDQFCLVNFYRPIGRDFCLLIESASDRSPAEHWEDPRPLSNILSQQWSALPWRPVCIAGKLFSASKDWNVWSIDPVWNRISQEHTRCLRNPQDKITSEFRIVPSHCQLTNPDNSRIFLPKIGKDPFWLSASFWGRGGFWGVSPMEDPRFWVIHFWTFIICKLLDSFFFKWIFGPPGIVSREFQKFWSRYGYF